MWIVLCPSDDLPALWAFQGLQARGLAPIELVVAEDLGLGVHWEHRVGTEYVSLHATLADGRQIRTGEVSGVLNRLLYAPLDSLALIAPADQAYVQQELQSFFLSWLYALPDPVINRPAAWGLSGQQRHISEWVVLAARAGLPVPPYYLSSRDLADVLRVTSRLAPEGAPVTTLFAVGDTVVSAPVPSEIQAGCLRLAELAETALLGIEFCVQAGGSWTFCGATPLPDLRLGGDALLDALARALAGEKEARP